MSNGVRSYLGSNHVSATKVSFSQTCSQCAMDDVAAAPSSSHVADRERSRYRDRERKSKRAEIMRKLDEMQEAMDIYARQDLFRARQVRQMLEHVDTIKAQVGENTTLLQNIWKAVGEDKQVVVQIDVKK